MQVLEPNVAQPVKSSAAVQRIGCVSFLNARPLIAGLENLDGSPNLAVDYHVPSHLLAQLESRCVDIALCPIIDFYASKEPLELVPVGGIGCCGPTLTVKLCSRVPFNQIKQVYVDADSHTSVALLQIVLSQRYGTRPHIITRCVGQSEEESTTFAQAEAVLFIGDKVVTCRPSTDEFAFQLDLGEAWHGLTQLPFVFAAWMSHADSNLGKLPALLSITKQQNLNQINQIAITYATKHGWPADLACRYLGQLLCYDIGPKQIQAIKLFADHAKTLGLIDEAVPLRIRSQIPQKV